MDGEAWWEAKSPRSLKELDVTERLHFTTIEVLDQNTIEVLNFCGAQGYMIFQKTAQVSEKQGQYLRHNS